MVYVPRGYFSCLRRCPRGCIRRSLFVDWGGFVGDKENCSQEGGRVGEFYVPRSFFTFNGHYRASSIKGSFLSGVIFKRFYRKYEGASEERSRNNEDFEV